MDNSDHYARGVFMKIENMKEIKIGFNASYIVRVMVFLLGIFVLALGAATIITADLGAATWDVLHIGLSKTIGLSVGRWVQIVGVIMVIVTAILERKRLAIGSVLNIVIVGFFLNIILDSGFMPSFTELIPRVIMLIIGIILMGTGSGMYVASRIGAGPRDGMTLFISKRFSISVGFSRTLLEVAALTCGWLVGGPVALGTFITVPLVGPVMEASLKACNRGLEKMNC